MTASHWTTLAHDGTLLCVASMSVTLLLASTILTLLILGSARIESAITCTDDF